MAGKRAGMEQSRRKDDIEALRAAAEARGIDTRGMTRQELLDALRGAGASAVPAHDKADSGEAVLDPDQEQAEPAQDAAEEADSVERHAKPTEAPTHPESPPASKRPGA